MPEPSTPSKADEGITKIISGLSARWALQLTIRDKSWSPAKHSALLQTTEQQIHSAIRYLFFKDRAALDSAIGQFERQAPGIKSKWQFKPRAEADVIPRRTRAGQASSSEDLVAQAEEDEKASEELRQCLFAKLQAARKSCNESKERVRGHLEEFRQPDLKRTDDGYAPQQGPTHDLLGPGSHH